MTDRSSVFPDGYLTQRLEDVHVSSKAFESIMREFSAHSDNDRWGAGHEADGLPKDGFVLLDSEGHCLKGAARLAGLPTPPYRWDNVGTRHLAGLAACFAFRVEPSIVIVRSDSGKVHALHSDMDCGIVALSYRR